MFSEDPQSQETCPCLSPDLGYGVCLGAAFRCGDIIEKKIVSGIIIGGFLARRSMVRMQ